MRLAFVVNANARAFVRRPALTQQIARELAGVATVFVTRDLAELRDAAERIVKTGADVVAIAGGDGSWGATITAVARASEESGRALPAFALAPGGTVGTAAASLGVSFGRDPIVGLRRVLAAAAPSAHPSFRSTKTLSVVDDTHAKRLAFIVGSGLVASFIGIYDASAEASARALREGAPAPLASRGGGALAAARTVGRIFVESFVGGPLAERVLSPMQCNVHVDGEPLPWTASSLVISTVLRNVGLGLDVCYRGDEDAERPHLVVSGLSPRELGPRMFRVLRGTGIVDAHERHRVGAHSGEQRLRHFDDLARRFAIDFGPELGRYVVDGDLRLAQSIEVSAGPTVRLLAPKSWTLVRK